MDELQEFIIECKNQIFKLTDNYLDNLQEIKFHIMDVIPKREAYSDNGEIELIKLMKLIDDIEQSNIDSFSENLVLSNVRKVILSSFIETLNQGRKSEKLVKVLQLFAQGYSKKEIGEKLGGYSEDNIRYDLSRIGKKLQTNNKLYDKYINEGENKNKYINSDNDFKAIEKLLKDLFEL